MKTPEKIKKGLEVCANAPETYDCPDCPYYKTSNCGDKVMADGFAYIQQLEAENSRKDDTIRNLTDLLNAAHDETAAAKKERDALFVEMKQCNDCYFCKHYGTAIEVEPCRSCILDFQHQDFKPGFVWRGVCPENTEVQEDE